MKIKRELIIEKISEKLTRYKMKRKDKKLFIEALILIVIYLLSFGIISLGRVQKTFFSQYVLTFIFAVIITLVIYFVYKKVIK